MHYSRFLPDQLQVIQEMLSNLKTFVRESKFFSKDIQKIYPFFSFLSDPALTAASTVRREDDTARQVSTTFSK